VTQRVLLAADFYPPFIGGAELQTALLARELAARGYQVAVATSWHQGLSELELDDGVRVRRLKGTASGVPAFFSDPAHRRYHPPFPDPGVVVGLRQLVRAFRPDVIHATGWIAYSCAIGAPPGVPLLLSARDFGYACPIRTLRRGGGICSGPALIRCLDSAARKYGAAKGAAAVAGVFGSRGALMARTSAVHVPSRFAGEMVERDLIDRHSGVALHVIPDMTRLAPDPPPADPGHFLDRLPTEPFILFVGALQPHKGVRELVEAYEGLEPRPPLVVIGTQWPDSPTSWPPGTSVFTDVPNTLVQEAWRRSLFGVAPSLWPETFGGVVTEAMLHRRAVVASGIGGPLDTVEPGITGLLVPPGDAGALRGAMQALIDDPARRQRMGEAGRERVERLFATGVVMPHFERLYASLARSARSTAVSKSRTAE
jgi:glycosyltransferase involved in cell wall biosynthesis